MGSVPPHLAALVKHEKPFDPGDIRFLSGPSMMEQAEFRANLIEQHDGHFPCTLGARPLSKNHRAALALCEYSRAVRGIARSQCEDMTQLATANQNRLGVLTCPPQPVTVQRGAR